MAKDAKKHSIFYMLRVANNLSAQEVADMMGRSQAWVFSIEAGRRSASAETLRQYVEGFNVMEEFLVYYLDPDRCPDDYREFLCTVLNYLVYGTVPYEVAAFDGKIEDLFPDAL